MLGFITSLERLWRNLVSIVGGMTSALPLQTLFQEILNSVQCLMKLEFKMAVGKNGS